MKQRVCSICGETIEYCIDIEKFVKEKKMERICFK